MSGALECVKFYNLSRHSYIIYLLSKFMISVYSIVGMTLK